MINKIKAKNFKIIEFVDINPKKGVTFIFGPNAAGKSTVMDIIENTLQGGKKILNPIRDNQERGETMIEIAGYKVKKIFTEKSVRLEVYDSDDNKIDGGLATIDKLVNKIGFDPHHFTRMNAKDQRAMLMKLLNLDFTELDADRAKLFDERKLIGSKKRDLPSFSVDEIKDAQSYKNIDEVSAVELSEKLQKAKAEHINFHDCQQEVEDNNIDIKVMEEKITELKKRNEELATVKIPTVDVPKLREQLDGVEDSNKKVRIAKSIIEEVEKSDSLGEQYEAKTNKIEMIDNHKKNVLKNAKMPLEGLSLTEECVTYEDRPLEQLSTSEGMKVSISICLLMMDPEKEIIILIRDGNLLDDKSLEVIEEMAREYNGYYLIEYVLTPEFDNETGEQTNIPKKGILIQEGKIKAIDGELVKQ